MYIKHSVVVMLENRSLECNLNTVLFNAGKQVSGMYLKHSVVVMLENRSLECT